MGLVVPRLIGRQKTANIDATRISIEGLSQALKLYSVDHDGNFPSTSEGMRALMEPAKKDPQWKGPLPRKKPPVDAWGETAAIPLPGLRKVQGYDIYSSGPDRAMGTTDDIGKLVMRERQHNAFTVFELVVVLALLVSALAFSLPAVSNWQRRSEMNRAESALMQMIVTRNATQFNRYALASWFQTGNRIVCSCINGIRSKVGARLASSMTPHFGNQSLDISRESIFASAYRNRRNGWSYRAVSPVGTISEATVRITHRVGWSSTWITHRLAGDIRAVQPGGNVWTEQMTAPETIPRHDSATIRDGCWSCCAVA